MQERKLTSDSMIVPLEVCRENVAVSGKWLKIATIKDEAFREGEVVPTAGLHQLLLDLSLNADLFSFTCKPSKQQPLTYPYYMESMNLAVVDTNSFQDWWEKELSQVTRKNVRRSVRRGVVVRPIECDDNFISGVTEIYNEVPIRDGRPFRHYGKTFDIVKREMSTMPERSEFLAAYFGNELIGFIKLVHMGRISSILHIVSKRAHDDKRPTNALVAAAVERCSGRQAEFLVYGQYHYGNRSNGPLTEFKRRNGFKKILVPRYFIPLTLRGKTCLATRLHHGPRALMPTWFVDRVLELRSRYYERELNKFLALQGLTTDIAKADAGE